MNRLPLEMRKKGFDFKQVERDDNWAIYEKSAEGLFIAYEVFRITIYPEREIQGNVIPEHEAYPYDEAFGVWAWTTPSLDRAREIMRINKEYHD